MEKRYKPLPPDHVKPVGEYGRLKPAYLVKKTYYGVSFLFFFLGLMAVPFFIYLDQTGQLSREDPYWSYFLYYIAVLAVLAAIFRLRCSFCALCHRFAWPTNLDYNAYCVHCGAHLFDFEAYKAQEVARSEFDLGIDERLLEMSRRGDTEAIRTLLEKGANLNYQDKYGFSALMRAAMQNRVEAINFLVGMGINIHLKNNFGLNALMLAVDQNRTEAVSSLLRYDFDLSNLTHDGRSVFDIATKNNNEDIVVLLEQHR